MLNSILDPVYKLIGSGMYWLSKLLGGNYVLVLLICALVTKLAFLYFSIKQHKGQIKMAKLAPKIELIKAKYKGRTDPASRQKMNEEIMALQQKEGYNMLSGCLPLFIQFPVILILYKIIRNPLDYIVQCDFNKLLNVFSKNPELNLLIQNPTFVNNLKNNQIHAVSIIKQYGIDITSALNKPDRALPNMSIFGIDLGNTPAFSLESFTNFGLFVLMLIPFITAAVQWLTVFLGRKLNGNPQAATADAQGKGSMIIMDLMMPAMTLFFAFKMPAIMGVYWVFQSVLSILQSVIFKFTMPVPKFTEEEIKQIQKEAKKAEKEQEKLIKAQPKVRSLHYIDEEDYEELPEMKANSDVQKPSMTGSDVPQIKD